MIRRSVALVHHPCVDKNGRIYTTAITNLDIHDIARSATTFSIDAYYVVTPIEAQRRLAECIVTYWCDAKGKRKNSDRAKALSRVHVCTSIKEAILVESKLSEGNLLKFGTSAKKTRKMIPFREGRMWVESSSSMIVLGTGYGLAGEVLEDMDYVLEPIQGSSSYNHLSVRSAAAIIFDRLLGRVDNYPLRPF